MSNRAEVVVLDRALVERLLDRLGFTMMTHNGHVQDCPRSWPDWLPSDPCNCGRDEDVKAVVEALNA